MKSDRERNRMADEMMTDVGAYARAGEWRRCADAYLDAYYTSSETWEYRQNVWSGYTSVLREGNMRVLESDFETLAAVANDGAAHIYDRVQAHFTLGHTRYSAREYVASREGYTAAITVAMSADEMHLNRVVTMASPEGYVPKRVGDLVDDLVSYALDNRRALAAVLPPAADHQSEAACSADNSGGSDLGGARFDEPVVLTASALEYSLSWFEIVMRRRSQEAAGAGAGADVGADADLAGASFAAGVSFAGINVSDDGEVAMVLPPPADVTPAGITQAASNPVPTPVRLRSSRFTDEFETPLPVPRASPRNCDVHSCVLSAEDHACLESGTCAPLPPSSLRGHLQPMGDQFKAPLAVAEGYDPHVADQHANGARRQGVTLRPGIRHGDERLDADGDLPLEIDAFSFWDKFVGGFRPVLIRGGAARAETSPWTDQWLTARCTLTTGRPWRALIEKNNRVVQNDRHPLMYEWNFCDFVRNYTKPEFKNMLYTVTPLSEPGVDLLRDLRIPEALRCRELRDTIREARLWMSGGNTTSSLHFDTHDNLMLQLDGTKEVLLFHPSQSHHFYSDFHNKFGLSPVSADRVDLDRFPDFANAAAYRTVLRKGDSLYLPDGWWHLIKSLPGRNVAVAIEFEPFVHHVLPLWPPEVLERYEWKGTFWAESVRIKYEMRQRLGATWYRSAATSRPVTCDDILPSVPFAHLSAQMASWRDGPGAAGAELA